MKRHRGSKALCIIGSSIALSVLAGCAPKTDYSDTNPPVKPATAGSPVAGEGTGAPRAQGRPVTVRPLPDVKKPGS